MSTLEDLKDKQPGLLRDVAKKDWIKTSFWVAENTPVLENQEELKAPSKKLICPIFDKSDSKSRHSIKFKDLISIKFYSFNSQDGN